MDCSLPGSSVHGILQARILELVAMPSSGDLPYSGIEPASLYMCMYIYSKRDRDKESERQGQTEREMSTFIKLNKLLIFSLLLNASFL